MNDVLQVADRIAVLYLGRMAAIVNRKDVDQQQLVELITTGRTGSIGLQATTNSGSV
jgi:D-xylose transport system ATP-binding protein